MDAERILKTCRAEIAHLFPVLLPAFAGLKTAEVRMPAAEEKSGKPGPSFLLGTDGDVLYYNQTKIKECWQNNPARLRHAVTHVLLHLLYGDLTDQTAPDLILDMRIEFILERELSSNPAAEQMLGRNPEVRRWMEKLAQTEMTQWAEIISKTCGRKGSSDTMVMKASSVFKFDTHIFWPNDQAVLPRLRKKWHRIAIAAGSSRLEKHSSPSRMSEGSGSGGRSGHDGRGLLGGGGNEDAGKVTRGTHDYRALLRRFAVYREEMELDMDSFDYIYYSLGMDRYGNMPLIEPLEYKEGHKAENIVIAIDTSGSCSLPMIRKFLSETWAMLDETENFFHRMDVHILQCDAVIERDTRIRTRQDWYRYVEQLKIEGRGGTDFRPAFQRAAELKAHGLIYLTDGDGVYPTQKPQFESVFVQLGDPKPNVLIPAWVSMICLPL